MFEDPPPFEDPLLFYIYQLISLAKSVLSGEFIFSTSHFTNLSCRVAPQMAVFAQKAWQKIDVAAGASVMGNAENLDQFCHWRKFSVEMYSDLHLKKKGQKPLKK